MAMSGRKSPRAFRPTCAGLEERTAPSLSFSGLMHSVFPFLGKDDTPAPRRPAGAHAAHVGKFAARGPRALHAARLAADAAPGTVDPNSNDPQARTNDPQARTDQAPTGVLAGRLARNAALARQAARDGMAVRNQLNGS